jgi:hypothetical protein
VKTLLALSAALTVALAAASTATSRSTSAEPPPPGVLVRHVLVDDKGVHLPNDQYTKNGVARYPRVPSIRYEFKNVGSKPYAVFLWGADTVVMKPHGGRATMLVNYQWAKPGTYHYYREYRGHKIAPIGKIIIY